MNRRCPSCGNPTATAFGQPCTDCEARTAAGRATEAGAEADDGTTQPDLPPEQHRPLPCGDTGRLWNLLGFFGLDGR